MRISGIALAAFLLVSATLFAQHNAGAGGFSGGHSSFGGSTSSIGSSVHSPVASSAGSSGTRAPSTNVAHGVSTRTESPQLSSNKNSPHPLVNSFRIVRATKFTSTQPRCASGQLRTHNGACVVATKTCWYGRSASALTCGTPAWSNNCNALIDQLAAERLQEFSSFASDGYLRRRLLQDQYAACLGRFGLNPFANYAFAFDGAIDIP